MPSINQNSPTLFTTEGDSSNDQIIAMYIYLLSYGDVIFY